MLGARRLIVWLLSVASLCGGLGLVAPVASASHSQIDFFEAPAQLLSASARPHALAQLQTLGVRALRVELHWHDVAPGANARTRPAFDASNPASYSWGQYDPLLEAAHRLGWTVLLTVTSPVPRWATANRRAPYVTRPDDLDFEQFMTAVARHFGSEVSLYGIWNEPNIAGWLAPQFNADGTPASPRIYRGLYEAGYAGLQAAGIAHPKVLFGETAPFGFSSVNPRTEGIGHDVAPLAFLRGALCLNAHYRRAASCAPLAAYGYAHHPYTYPAVQGVYYRPPARDQVTIGVLARLSAALDAAGRAGSITAHLPIYLTEFGVQSKPSGLGVSLERQAAYDAVSEEIAWSNQRVAAFSQYLLQDENGQGPFGGSRTGLETASGARKPLYTAYPVPLAVTRQGRGVMLWGRARPASAPTHVTVLVQRRGSSHFRVLATVATNALGYWTLHSATPGSRWRVRWVSPAGVKYEGPSTSVY